MYQENRLAKLQVLQTRIVEWYNYLNGSLYRFYSGDKDSLVLSDLTKFLLWLIKLAEKI